MLLPRVVHSSLITRHILRSFPSRTPLGNGVASTQLRSISVLTTKNAFRSKCTMASFYPSARHSHPSSSLSKLWPQQTRGMKTRSSVKRLCDGCKVGDNSKSSSSHSGTLTCVTCSRSEGRAECTSYGMCCGGSHRAGLNIHLTLSSSKNPKHKQRQGK